MPISKDVEKRRHEVYRAEMASGIYAMRPLASIHDVQMLINDILKERYWRKLSDVRKCVVSYVPSWELESGCGWVEYHPAKASLEGAIGSMCEGLVYHELAHLAREDRDNGHRFHFLRLEFALYENNSDSAGSTLLPRYAAELLARNLVTGREDFLQPYLKAWAKQCEQMAKWLKPYLEAK